MNSSDMMIIMGIFALIAACIPAASIEVSVTGDDGSSAQTVNIDMNVAQDTSMRGTVAIDGAKVNPDIKTKGAVKSFEQTHQVTDSTGKHAEVYAKVINGTDISYKSQVYPKEGSLKKASEWVKAEEWLDVGSADYIKASAMASFGLLSSGGSTEVVSGSLMGYHNLAYTDGNVTETSQFGPAGEDPVFRASGEKITVSSYGRDNEGFFRLTTSLKQEGAASAQFAGRTEGRFGETVQYISSANADNISIEDLRFKPGDSKKVTLNHYGNLEGIAASRNSGRIIEDMLKFSDSGDLLSIGPGLYQERIVLDKDMSVQGESRELTIIDAPQYGEMGSIFDIKPGVNAQISDMTIQGGSGNYCESSGTYCGGGVFNQGTLTIDDTTISGNTAIYGGGIFNKGTVILTNSSVLDNRAEWNSGGIYNDYSSFVELINSSVDHNIAQSDGGGIYNYGSMNLIGSSIDHNTAGNAAGIYNGGTINATDSSISDNIAGWSTGGIYNSGTINLTRSSIDHNMAQYAGGIYNSYGGTISATDSSISDNIAQSEGGGIYNYGYVELHSSSIDNGTAQNGGGVYNDGTIYAIDSSISDNVAGWNGGAIYNLYYGSVQLFNSSIDHNMARSAGGVYNSGTITAMNSAISHNTAEYEGGGIYNDYSGTVDLICSSVDNNTAQHAGGMYNSYDGRIYATDSSISDNAAEGNGGAIYNRWFVQLLNSSIYHNTAQNGGGVFNGYGSGFLVKNSTISQNIAEYEGGGIYNDYYSSVDLITGSIEQNIAQNAGGIFNGYEGGIYGDIEIVHDNTPFDIWPSNSSPTWP